MTLIDPGFLDWLLADEQARTDLLVALYGPQWREHAIRTVADDTGDTRHHTRRLPTPLAAAEVMAEHLRGTIAHDGTEDRSATSRTLGWHIRSGDSWEPIPTLAIIRTLSTELATIETTIVERTPALTRENGKPTHNAHRNSMRLAALAVNALRALLSNDRHAPRMLSFLRVMPGFDLPVDFMRKHVIDLLRTYVAEVGISRVGTIRSPDLWRWVQREEHDAVALSRGRNGFLALTDTVLGKRAGSHGVWHVTPDIRALIDVTERDELTTLHVISGADVEAV